MPVEHDPTGGRIPSTSPIIKRDFSIQPSMPISAVLQPASPPPRNYEKDITSPAGDVSTPITKYRFPFPLGVNTARETTFSDTAPQFAEQFTPLARKPRKQHGSRNTDSQATIPAAGQSKAGWYDADEGDLYRGAENHPGLLDGFSKRPDAADAADAGKPGDTASVNTTISSSSSSSGLEIGRRVTQAIDKVGDALHFRRGSVSSTNTKTDTLTTITTRDSSSTSTSGDSDTSSSSSSSDDDGATSSGVFRRKRHRRRSVRSKTISRRSASPDGLSAGAGRRRIITRREFTLMLPTPVGEDDISVAPIPDPRPSTARVRIALPPDSAQYDGNYSGPIGHSPLEQPNHDWHGRLITTPALRTVMDKIRDERKKSGYEAAFQAETEKREARERRKRKRRSHHHHGRHQSTEQGFGVDDRRSGGESKHRERTPRDEYSDHRARRRAPKNRLEQLRAAQEPQKVRFDEQTNSSTSHDIVPGDPGDLATRNFRPDIRSAISDIIRPKSASDLLGLKDNIASSSSTSIKSLGMSAVPRPVPKRSLPFKLPPRPIHRSLTTNGPQGGSGLAKPFQPVDSTLEVKKGCWWLDVSCPTWQDLRDLGELLHLHPLTLEDVLQQDPREKIDVFENLGYHFIVFRAIDETYFKYTAPEAVNKSGFAGGRGSRKGKLEIVEDRPGKEGLEGVGVGGLNVYIVVFADGIVSFHNDDISKHTERVREKILTLQRDSASPEWIAHGLLDSIVDAFFPLISHIDDEVDEIDTLVIDPSNIAIKEKAKAEHLPLEALNMASDKTEVFELQEKINMDEKSVAAKPKKKKKKRRPLSKRIRRGWKHLRRAIVARHGRWQVWLNQSKVGEAMNVAFQYLRKASGMRRAHRANQSAAFQPVFDRTSLLQRMTEMRRLVTGLTRLLGAKHQVIKRLRKRAAIKGGEVGVYISDVQDHIIMLQTSLLHYEYILSHCQPAYMAHLNVTFAIARSGTSDLILALSVVGIGILPLQFITGMFSLNIQVPHNGDRDEHKNPDGTSAGYSWFFVVLAIAVVIVVGYGYLVKFWREQARRKGRMAMLENGPQPKSTGFASAARRRWESTIIRFRKGV
ncbi:hypothetical protein QFC21_000930 [Naganishia friedmannii]|uniref:Uncharacterized protein n=1 Tax=Naganishia friedmannii TaxID=89922 RepID=A0ACC2WA59_9TREE|nr:hypothetical protein QFC21_000930 [Naganishia friedmannii]